MVTAMTSLEFAAPDLPSDGISPGRHSFPVRVAHVTSKAEDSSLQGSFWCGNSGCDIRRHELHVNVEDDPQSSRSRPMPKTCGGGSWEEAASADLESTTAEEDETQEIHVHIAEVNAMSPCSEDNRSERAAESKEAPKMSETTGPAEAASSMWCGWCAPQEPEATHIGSMRESRSEEQYSSVLPTPPSAPDNASVVSSTGTRWGQRAFVISVSTVSAAVLATAAGGVLPVAIAAGSMGFTLGLLSSILGIRVGRWVS